MAKTQEERRAQRRKMMVDGPLLPVISTLAFPMIISQLVNSIYSLADTFFVSQLGNSATAAIGVNDALTHFTNAVALGFGAGAAKLYIKAFRGEER